MSKPKKVALFIILPILAVATGFGIAQLDLRRSQNQPAEQTSEQTTSPSAATTDKITYQGADGKTALELLKSKADVKTKASSLGELVESINGQDGGGQKFWLYYVNDQPAQVGADKYETKDSDTIEWRLE